MAAEQTDNASLVSVIIPVYNAERYVAQAVASALALPETGEVLLIEDGSPDGALAVCERLAAEDDRVRLLRHPNGENRGAGASRNLGIEAAKCKYVAFLDADDYFLPNRYEKALAILESDPSVDGVYEAVGTVCEGEAAAAFWHRAHPDGNLTTITDALAPEDLFDRLIGGRHGYFHTDGILVRRSLFDRTGLFPPHLRMCQDTCMWLKMALAGRLVGGSLDEPVAMRRVHGENRIIRNAGEHAYYGYLVCEELLQWMPSECVTPARLSMLRTGKLKSLRRYLGGGIHRLGFRWFWCAAMLVRLLREDATVLRESLYWECVAELTGLPWVWRRLRRLAAG